MNQSDKCKCIVENEAQTSNKTKSDEIEKQMKKKFEKGLKKRYKKQKLLKLSTLSEMDKFILYYMNSIMHSNQLSYDIIRIILLFYMYDLSKYEYIAIFTCFEKSQINDNTENIPIHGHLSTFNITDNLSASRKSQFKNIKRCDISVSLKQLTKEVYGTSFRLFSLNKFPPFIANNLFPKYSKVMSPTLNLHVLFRIESESTDTNYAISVSLLELDEHMFLKTKPVSERFDRCELLQSSIHGLIALGGGTWNKKGTVKVLKWNKYKSEFSWDMNKIAPMKTARFNHRAVIFENENKIFVCGGNNGIKSAELYSFQTTEWMNVKPMNYARDCHGCYYDKYRNVVYALDTYDGHKKVEKYVCEKNEWFNLPDLNYAHRWNPVVKMIDNNVLMITGDFYKYNKSMSDDINGYGCCEYLDLRQENKQWNVIDKYIADALGFTHNEYQNKNMRGIWLL